MEASRWPMVIEPLSLIFFRVPSCAAAGTARARARTARISVGRFMSVSLWAVRVGRCMGGGGCTILRESPIPCPSGRVDRAGAKRLGRTRIRPLPEKERDMSQVATRIEHDLLGDRAVPAEAYYGI